MVGFGFTDKPLSLLNCARLPNFEYRQFGLPHDRLAYLNAGILAPLGWSQRLRDLDLYWVTSPMMLDILVPDGGPFPIVALVHDLIPQLFRQSYPGQMTEHQWLLYDARLDKVKDYDFCLTNSEATRRDVCRLLGIAPERVGALGIGIGERFFERLPGSALRRVRERYSIVPPYILSVTGHQYRKNWEAVFQSFASLPASDRRAYQLVVVCQLDPQSRHDLSHLAKSLGIAARTVLTDAVDEETLRGLYKGASALIFPSLYEGFGIPLIEAMATGVPIVCSDVEVFHEIAAEAARFVDPTRTDLLAGALHDILSDASLRRRLVEEGHRQIENYRWPRIVERAESFLTKIVSRRPATITTRAAEPPTTGGPAVPPERVAYFTLLPPQVSGIADYNESLVRELAKHVRLELFLDDIVPAHPEIRENLVWHSSRDFPLLQRDQPYDLIVYHIGNNVQHGRQYRMATTFPGIVMLHDYCLRLFAPLCNQRFSFLETHDDIERYYGLSFPLGMPAEQIFFQLSLLEHPLNERLIEHSLGLTVHSQWSRTRIHRRFADKPVEVVPFGIDPDPRRHIRPGAEIRQRYRLSPDAFVVTSAGNLTPMKRLTTILQAFAEVVDHVPEAVLCLVGQATDPQYFLRLHQLVAELGLAGLVRFLGYVEMEELYDILDMSDVCLNLRYPTLGETSAVLLRMMQLGKPIIVSGIAQFLEFPDTICWKAEVEDAEQMQLVRYLRVLARSPEVRATLGENARRYVQGWTWDRVAPIHVETWRRILHQQKSQR